MTYKIIPSAYFQYMLLFSFVVCSAFSCKTSKIIVEKEPTKCKTHGTVRDYSNVEDCGYIIEMESGMFLFPQSLKSEDKNFHLEPGLNIRFDYELRPNSVSMCPVKGKVAEITCITQLPSRDINCIDCDSPTSEWMIQIIDILKPKFIYKYLTDKEILYVFDCPAEKVMYDCLGNCICQEYKNDNSKCPTIPTRTGKIIYQAEENQN